MNKKLYIALVLSLYGVAFNATAEGGMGIMPVIGQSQLSEYARTANQEAHTGAKKRSNPSTPIDQQSAEQVSPADQQNQNPQYTDEELIQNYVGAADTLVRHAYDLSDARVPEGMGRAWVYVELQMHREMFARFISNAHLPDSVRGTIGRQVMEMFHSNLPPDTPQRDIEQIYSDAIDQVRHTVDTLWAYQQQR